MKQTSGRYQFNKREYELRKIIELRKEGKNEIEIANILGIPRTRVRMVGHIYAKGKIDGKNKEA